MGGFFLAEVGIAHPGQVIRTGRGFRRDPVQLRL
jgi:hypothetical protein